MARGLDTFNSCQDFDGCVWVEFDGPSATDFLNLVAGQDSDLRSRMLRSRDGDGWTYSVLPWPEWDGEPEIRFLVSVHFPRCDLAAVEAALREAPSG